MFGAKGGEHTALFWEKENSAVRCGLCSHRCLVHEGKQGICGVRQTRKAKMYSQVFGRASSMAVDPVEKKPLYHFRPGSRVFSLGTVGCNFSCLNCQNNDISCAGPDAFFLKDVTAEDVVRLAMDKGCRSIAWTYNEPTMWYEFTLESSRLAKKEGLEIIYVTNGYMTKEALEEHSSCLDAMNIDVKAFDEKFYNKIVGAKLQPVLDTCTTARDMGIHVELTYLLIPGHNDDKEQLKEFAHWVVENMGEDTPVHFSRFHPQHKMMDTPMTPMGSLDLAYDTAREEGLRYVYLGNVRGDEREDTYCHSCKELLLKRSGFSIVQSRLAGNKCPGCGTEIPVIL